MVARKAGDGINACSEPLRCRVGPSIAPRPYGRGVDYLEAYAFPSSAGRRIRWHAAVVLGKFEPVMASRGDGAAAYGRSVHNAGRDRRVHVLERSYRIVALRTEPSRRREQ